MAALVWPAPRLSSQSINVTAVNGVVHVSAPGLRFIEGGTLARLKDGQSVRVDFELTVHEKPGATPTAQRKQAFILSYDLWEERFAVTTPDVPSRSISHVTPTAAEAWCLQQLAVPLSALGPLAKNLPFWVRLEYRVPDGDVSSERNEGFTLRGLIDLLSRRSQTGEVAHTIEGGPFRIQK